LEETEPGINPREFGGDVEAMSEVAYEQRHMGVVLETLTSILDIRRHK